MTHLSHEINATELETVMAELAPHGLNLTHYKSGLTLQQLTAAGWAIVHRHRPAEPEPELDDEQRERVAALRATVSDLENFGHLTPAEALACAHFVYEGSLPGDWTDLTGDLLGDRGTSS